MPDYTPHWNFSEGETLLIDKPYGWTSFAVVAQLKKWTRCKIGHAGTLDPLASGLMILCTGKSTKLLTGLTGLDKEYRAIFRLGASTPTYDLESLPENDSDWEAIPTNALDEAVSRLSGPITQYPPIHSAIKQDGKPLYSLARQGKTVEVKARQVLIHQFEIERINLPEIHVRIACSSGTYIRSMAHDLGQILGCGAYLQSLRRTAIGPHRIENAWSLTALSQHLGPLMNARIIAPKIDLNQVVD